MTVYIVGDKAFTSVDTAQDYLRKLQFGTGMRLEPIKTFEVLETVTPPKHILIAGLFDDKGNLVSFNMYGDSKQTRFKSKPLPFGMIVEGTLMVEAMEDVDTFESRAKASVVEWYQKYSKRRNI